MNTSLDQLVFGWSEAGLEGRNRLQMVATSESWRVDNRYRRVALRLSRLDAPSDRDPISFGWADLGGRRYVFQRRMIDSSRGDARRLIAHVVAGPPEQLPIGDVLRAFDSRFWWHGQPLEPVLAPALPESIIGDWSERRRPAPSAVTEPIIGRILAAGAGTPVGFDGTPHEMYSALWGVHERLPRLLETVSCSTYESGQMATWFDVVGLDGRPRPRGSLLCSREASQPRYDGGQLADLDTMVSVAARGRSTNDAEGPRVYRETLKVSERIVSGRAHAIPGLLTRPATLSSVLASDLGARGVAEAMWSVDKQTWPMLPATDEAQVARLNRLALAAADVARSHAGASLGLVARRLHSVNPRTAPAYVERVLTRRAAGQALPTPDEDFLAVVLEWASKRDLSVEILGALATWVDQHLTGALLVDRRIPPHWRQEFFGVAALRGVLEIDDYADLASLHPDLFEDPSWLPTDRQAVTALAAHGGALSRVTAEAVVAQWSTSDSVMFVVDLWRSGHVEHAAVVLGALCRAESLALAEIEAAYIWSVLEDLAEASALGRISLGLYDLPWGILRHKGGSGRWIAAAAEVMYRGRGNADQRSREWPKVIAGFEGEAQAALTRLALHDLVVTSQTDWALTGHLSKLPLASLPRAERASATFAALSRRSGGPDQLVPVLILALSAAVERTGFFGTKVSAGEFEEIARAQTARVLAAEGTAFTAAQAGSRSVRRWLRAAGALR